MGLPATAWFDALYYKETNEDQADVLNRAWDYVKSIRTAHKRQVPISGQTPILPKPYCNHHADCIENKVKFHSQTYKTPRIFCGAKNIPQVSRTSRKCNWFVEDERIVKEAGKWVLISRQEHIRELLLCPHPGKQNNNHMTSRELAKSKEFWTWILGEVVGLLLKGLMMKIRCIQ